MAYLHKVITTMRSRGCVGFALDSKRGLVFHRGDGEEFLTGLRFTAVQISQILAEVSPMPAQGRVDSYTFEERLDGSIYEVSVTCVDGASVLRVSAVERGAVLAPPPLPRPAPVAVPETRAVVSTPPMPTSTPLRQLPAELDRLLRPSLPPILKMPERTERAMAGVFGMLLGLGMAGVMATATTPGGLFHQMFDPSTPTTAVPVLICCFFFWASLICVTRWLRLRELERLLPAAAITNIAHAVECSGSEPVARAIEQVPAAAATPLLRRCAAVLRQWTVNPGLQNADIVLRQHVANDEEAVHRGYNLVRTFVWALPVLGLIGTVVGIALAVGGFASFLGGSIDDVRVVKQNLVGVTGGLSFAFLITLLGLLTSLVVMLVSSGLQTREERFYGTVQHDIVESLLPVLQKAAPESHDAPVPASSAWLASVPKIVEAIEAAARTTIDARERERREEIVSFTRAVTDASKEVAGQTVLVRDTAKALGGLVEATKSALAQQTTLQTGVRTAADSLTEMSSAVSALQLGTKTLRESVLQVGAALNQLDARSMSQAFAAMRVSLEQLAPILQSFRGPFVFQAVPVDPERGVNGQSRSRG